MMTTDDLHEALVKAQRASSVSAFEVARLLWEFERAAGYADFGCANLAEYGEHQLGLSARETRDLVRIGRRLPELPRVAEAFSRGQLGLSKVRELVRVATAATEAAWVERATEVPCRVLERDVAASEVGDPPPEGAGDDEPLPKRVRLSFDVSIADAEVIRDALNVLRARAGDEADVEDGVLWAQLARRVLHESDTPEAPMPEERYRVVLQRCPTCVATALVARDGDHAVAPEIVAEASCDHEQVEAEGPDRGRLTHAPSGASCARPCAAGTGSPTSCGLTHRRRAGSCSIATATSVWSRAAGITRGSTCTTSSLAQMAEITRSPTS